MDLKQSVEDKDEGECQVVTPMDLKRSVGDEDEDQCQVVVGQTKKLPSDAIYEILTRVTLCNLLRQCQWVSKDWQKLIICDKKFQRIHSQRAPGIASGYLIQCVDKRYGYTFRFVPVPDINDQNQHDSTQLASPSLDFLPTAEYIKIACSAQYGSLLCCIGKSTDARRTPTYYVCKPATREWRKIPIPKTRLTTSKIGIVVTRTYPILQYKILRISSAKGDGYGQLHCEVFDSSNSAWKRLKCIKFNRPITCLHGGDGVLVNGGLHWLTRYNQVFVYYVEQEKWTIIKISKEMKKLAEEYFSLAVDCNGELGILYSTKESMEIWTLETYCTTNPIWKRKYFNDVRMIQGRGGFPIHMWSGDTVTFTSNREIMWFNCKTNAFTATNLPWEKCMAGQPYAFHSNYSYF